MSAEKLSDTIEIYRFKEVNNTFTGTCNIVYTDEHHTSCTIKGLAATIDYADIREISLHLISNGVRDCHYERRKDGYTLYKRWSLNLKCRVRKSQHGGN